MKLRMAVGVWCVMLLGAVVFVQAQEATAEKPKKQPMARLTLPWNKISNLSDEQRTQIRQIHAKALAEIRAIEEKERADVMALLSDEQKTEAERLMAEQKKPRPRAQKQGDPSNEKKVEEKKE